MCQNQSIDDSNAALAKDLRLFVRERLTAGDGDAAVLAFVEARYGEFVLLRPKLNAHTLLLWLAPFSCWRPRRWAPDPPHPRECGPPPTGRPCRRPAPSNAPAGVAAAGPSFAGNKTAKARPVRGYEPLLAGRRRGQC